MQDTLGHRIAALRKQHGMTQDQLAEKLGLTAQAVSKWENDQSCPDISMLPRLAELFGVTTDQLLGVEKEQVHQGEVVHNSPAKGKKGSWSWNFDVEDAPGDRAGAISFALMIILCGVLMLLRGILQLDYSFWDVFWPCGILFVGVAGLLKKFSFVSAGFALFGGLFLLENTGLLQLNINGGWVFPVLLILFGLSLLPNAFRKRKPRFSFTYNSDGGKEGHRQPTSSCSQEDGYFECSCCFGEFHQLVETELLKGGEMSVSFGELTLDLSGCAAAEPNCVIEASCSFGEGVILVPSHLRLIPHKSTSFGNIAVTGTPDPDATPVQLDASASFGELCVRYL